MLKYLYTQIVLAFPRTVLCVLFTCILILSYGATKLEIDASAETLLLEHDADLNYAKRVSKRYKGDDFLVIAYSPKDDLFSPQTLSTIESLSQELLKIDRIQRITSILTVPLLQSPPRPVKELVDEVLTLRSSTVDLALAKQEFLKSPLYKDNLVSSDFTTTALLLHLKPDLEAEVMKDERTALKDKKALELLSLEEETRLSELDKAFKLYRDKQRQKEHDAIEQIRAVMSDYTISGDLFLGGVNMIADDLVSFVKKDLSIFGTLLLSLVIFTLWLIFRQLRWIFIPVIISIFSVIATTGILGFMGWEVTVISSNFVSLQLIITLSVILHLMVRYRELSLKYRRSNQYKLILNTVLSKANPSFFAIITTIAGFSSLLLSGILPIINLGWMMSVGIALSLIIAFLVFPAIMILLPKKQPIKSFELRFSPITLCASLTEHHGKKVLIISLFIFMIGITGSSRLIVENSFINYFKENTAIYQGMKVIDQHLGGTTPLDIILSFKEEPKTILPETLDEFEAEFEEEKSAAQYWFTPRKIEAIQRVHNYLKSIGEIGNVQSLSTMLEIGKSLNENKELDSFQLALLYNKLPSNYRKFILDPYVNVEANEARFTTRIVDSNEHLRRNELLARMNQDLSSLIPSDIGETKLSGLMVLYNNMLQSLFFSQIVTLSVVVLIIWGMFILLFRSLHVATIAIVSNIVPMSTIFGFMGWLGIPLDMMTITIAAISIGIGVDDTIHYIHRFQHELKLVQGNYLEAMLRSHASIGYGMYYTSLAIMMGFLILVVSNFIPTIYFGLLTVLVMFSSLLAALLLLPKLLILFKPFKN